MNDPEMGMKEDISPIACMTKRMSSCRISSNPPIHSSIPTREKLMRRPAGPAVWIPLPRATKNPEPMTPPNAIILVGSAKSPRQVEKMYSLNMPPLETSHELRLDCWGLVVTACILDSCRFQVFVIDIRFDDVQIMSMLSRNVGIVANRSHCWVSGPKLDAPMDA